MERLIVLLVALVVSTNAGPLQKISIDSCSRTCTDSTKFNYVPGSSYEYVYRANLKTMIQGANTDEAGLIMTATVNLDVLSKCELSMRLSDIKLDELDPNNTPTTDMTRGFAGPLQKNPIRISFQDGSVEHLCLTGEEPTWVLNVKRGIVSMLQNSMEEFTSNKTLSETDVSGDCQTSYAVQGSGWYTTTISKTKDLLGCKGRQGYNSAVHGIPYSSDSSIQSLPILKSNMDCSHEVDTQTGLLKRATCNENHVFRPFSNSDSGAATTNTQELKYLRQIKGIRGPAGIGKEPVSLRFEHHNDVSQGDDPARDLKRKLLEICQKTKSGVQPETPRLFTDLVYMIKSADSGVLNVVYDLVKGNSFCPDNKLRTRKFFLDALPMAGTSAAVSLMTSLITRKTVTGSEADMWITSLSFIKKPTEDMLREVKPLINMEGYEGKSLLSVGTLIHNYCYHHGTCDRDSTVAALISAMENKMAKKCKVTPETKKETLMALRGIGNAGYAVGAIPTLVACMQSPLTEIRLSAIDAYRRMPCYADRRKLMNVFLDQEEDSEVRIASYRAVMQCPTTQILAKVKSALEQEQVNQVGSYVWTHLTNLMETSDRHKQDIRAILEDETFKKEFDLDKRKFSRNYEGSFFLDALNTGAKVEGDLIWSSKSFIPRSSMVNLTVDLFGHSVNLFEVGGRVEGLEHLLETFFGPSGYFSQKASPASNELMTPLVHPEKMKRINNRFGSKIDQLRGSMYMRVFGNELKYSSFDGMESLMAVPDFDIMEMLKPLAKDNEYTYSHSSMFLDSSIIIPTGSGFPLNLTVNGTSTMDLRMKGKMDFTQIPNIIIDGLIKPSAAIDISSMMSVDAFVTKPGLKMVSTLHSSTAIQGKIIVKKDGSVSAEYQMPQSKMEIIDVKTSFFTIHANVEREQIMTPNRVEESLCSPNKLVTITGLDLCGEVSYPRAQKADAPYLPFTGPASAGVYLYRRDTNTKYELNIKSLHDMTKNVLHFQFNTPDSKIDRHILADVTLNKQMNTLDMTFTSPWSMAAMKGSYTSNKGSTALDGRVTIDGKFDYLVEAKMVKDRVQNAHRYTPSLVITIPHRQPISLKGMFMYNGYRQFDIEYSMKGVTEKPVSAVVTINNRPALQGIKASLELEKGKPYSLDANMNTQETKKKILFKPFISVRSPTAEVLSFGGTIANVYGKKYDVNLLLDKVVEKKVSMKGFVSQLAKRRGRIIYRTVMKFASSPMDVNLDCKVDNRNYKVIGTDFDITYIIRKVARNNIHMVSKIQNLSSKQLKKGKATLNFAVKRNPELNVKLLGNVNHNKKHTDMDLDIRYGANFKDEKKHIDMAFELNRNIKSLTQVSGDISSRFRYPGMGLTMMMKGSHEHTQQNLYTNMEMRFGKNPPIQSSLRMWERWEKLGKASGEYLLSYPGRNFAINHTLEATTTNKFVSTLNVQTQKGQKNSIVTTMENKKEENVKLMSDLFLNGHTPLHLQGEFQLNPKDFITSLSMEKDSKKYAGSLKSRTDPLKYTSLTVDVEHPTRRVIFFTEGKDLNGVWHGEADFRWNAVRNDTERVQTIWMLEPPTPEKLNGSLTLSYPSRTLKLSGHHIQGKKYLTNANFQWDVNQKISADTVVSVIDGSIIAKGKLTTPFARIQTLAIDLTHKDSKDEYLTNVAVDLNSKKSISVETMLKKPLSLHTLVAYIQTRNNFADIKKMRLDIDHKLSRSLASSAKFSFNRQVIQAQVTLQNTSRAQKVGIEGRLDIKTTFKYMKKASIEFSHDNNGKVYNTMAKAVRNKRVYTVNSKMSQLANVNMFENKGSVDISIPTEAYATSWLHKHTQSNMLTSYSTKWGKKKQFEVAMKFDANFKDNFDSSLRIDTPFSNIMAQTSFTNEEMETNAKFSLLRNSKVIGASEIGYKMDEMTAKARASLTIPKLNVDSSLQADFDNKDLAASLNAIVTPDMTASLDITTGLVLFKSTFPGYEQVRYTNDIQDDKQLIYTETLEYGNGKIIRLQTKLNIDSATKHVYLELTTPFESMTRVSAGVNFLGDLESFITGGFVEMLPVFNKISAAANYNTKSEVSGKLRLDTPFQDFEYFQADFFGKFEQFKDNIHVEIEYQPSKIIKLEVEGIRNSAQTTLSTTLKVPSASLSYSHKVSKSVLDSSAELELFDQKYGADFNLKTMPDISSTLTVSVPSRRPITITISHKGEALDFEVHAGVKHNRKNSFVSDLVFQVNDKIAITSRAALKTEMISDEEYSVAASYHGTASQFNLHSEVTTTSIGKSFCDISFDTEREISGSASLISPLIKNIKASFNHYYSSGFLQTRADVIRGGKRLIDMDVSLKTAQSVVAEFTMQTPITKNIQGLVRFDGARDNFAVHAEGSHGTRKAEMEYISRIADISLQQSVTIKATNITDITAELSLSQSPEYKGFAEIKFGIDKHRIDVSFNNVKSIEGTMSLVSPMVEPISASFNILGQMKNFQSVGDFTVGSKKNELQVTFMSTGRLEGSLSLTSPYMKSITASFKHIGDLSDMISQGKFALDNDEFDGKLTISTQGKLSGSVSVTTPYSEWRNAKAAVSHQGGLENFRCHGEYTIGNYISNIDLSYNSISKYEGLLTITSHLIPDVSAGFEHTGSVRNFKTHGEFSIGQKKTEADMDFIMENDLVMNIKLSAPDTEPLSAKLTHQGILSGFKSHAELMYEAEKYQGEVSFNVKDKITGQMSLSLGSAMSDLEVAFEHTSQPNLRSHVEVKFGDDQTIGDIFLSHTDTALVSSLSLTSPYIDEIDFNMRYTIAAPKQHNSHVDMKYGVKMMNADYSMAWAKETVSSTMSFSSSYTEDILIKVNHDGPMKNFVTSANVMIGNEQSTGEASFQTEGQSVVSKLNVKSKITNLEVNFNHYGKLPQFKTHADISVDGSISDIDIQVNILDDIAISASVTAPEMSFKLKHNGHPLNFHSLVEVTKNAETYAARANLQTDPEIEASIDIESPISNHESYKVIYKHKGIPNDFHCHLEVHSPSKSSISDLDVNNKRATLDISYPEIKVRVSNDIVPGQRFESMAELVVLGKSYSSVARFENESSQWTGQIEMKSSHEEYRLFKLAGTLSKPDQTKGLANVELALNNDQNVIEATFSAIPKLDGSLSIRTVYIPQIDIKADLQGTLDNVKASAEMLLDGEKKGKVQTEWDLVNQKTAILNIETPFENFTSINANIVFRVMDVSNIDASALIKLEGDNIIDTAVKFTMGNKIEGEARFDSIYLHPTYATVSMQQDQDTYKVSSKVTHNFENLLEVNGGLTNPSDLLNANGFLAINPFFLEKFIVDGFDGLNIAVSLKNTETAFNTHTEATINRRKWEAETSYTSDRDETQTNFRLGMPDKDPVQGGFSFKNKFSKYIIKANLDLDSMTKYGYDMNVKTRNGMKGRISLTTPVEGMEKTIITFESEGNIPNFKSEAGISYSDKHLTASASLIHTSDKTSGAMTIVTPFTGFEKIETSFFKEGIISDFKAGGKVIYAIGEAVEASIEHKLIGSTIKSKVTFMSPFTNEITLSTDHSGPLDDFTSTVQLSLGPDNGLKSETTFKTSSNYLSFLTNLETTMTGETSKQTVEVHHEGSIQKFNCDAKLQSDMKVIQFDASFQLDPVIEGSVSLITPFKSVEELKASFSHSGSASTFLTTGEVQYAPQTKVSGKLDVLIHDISRMEMSAELKTPFTGYKESKITYHHSGSISNFQCENTILFASKEISTVLTGRITPPNFSLNIRTPFEGYQNIDMKFSYTKDRLGHCNAHAEGSWSPGKTVAMDINFSNIHNKLEANGVLSTPFSTVEAASFEASHNGQLSSLMQTLKASLNGENLIDIETDLNMMTDHKHAKLITRAPLAMKYEIEGDFTINCVDVTATANWDTQVTGKLVKLECGYDVREENTAHFKLTGLGKLVSYNGQFLSQQATSELMLDTPMVSGRYGFDISYKGKYAIAKVMLPGQSLELSGTMRPSMTTGKFLWDADNDKTKAIELQSVVVPSKDSVKAELTLKMPSLGKEVRLRSEGILNRGRMIFGGKAELDYSGDERQKLMFSTSLEDVSTNRNTNYSFSLGVSHPYSTVGIKLASHIGKSLDQYSAGMGVEYLTARRQTKTFQVGGIVNKLRKTAKFELQSPVKSISISSGLKTEDEFQVTLTNTYDQKQPLSTVFTINPSKKSVELITNYDLDNPRSEYHLLARYVNSSAVEAEAFRLVNRAHETDILLAARLNSSQLLHSRLHWRPELIQDLKAYKEKKMQEYEARSLALLKEVEKSMLEEFVEKSELIWDTMEQELGPKTMAALQERLNPMIQSGAVLVQDMLTHTFDNYLNPLADMANTAQAKYNNITLQYVPSQLPSLPSINLGMLIDNKPADKMQAMKQTVKNVLPSNSIMDVVISVIDKEIELAAKDLASVHFDWKTTVYDPEHGEIQVEFHLPIPLTSLDVAPVINLEKYLRKIRQSIPAKPSMDSYLPDLSSGWLPPFNGVATISNGHQITTFDGYMYDLPVDCTLILARDFMDGNFTLVLSNKGDTTLTLLSGEKPIEINIGGKVTVGGKELAEGPINMKGVTIFKDEANITHINADNIFDITYDTSIDHITIEMNGWYYGKTGGLLGTYDNEPSNDLKTSFGKVNYNTARFAKTWEVGRKSC